MKSELQAKFLQHLVQKHQDDNKGFTLIELLVVIIIIGILSAIALPSFLNQANKARQSEASTYIGSINRAQQAHFLEKTAFGTNLAALELGIADSKNYTYATGGATAATSTATPKAGSKLKGYAGRVYLGTGSDGTSTTLAILCEGAQEVVPAVTGTVCP